MPELCVDPRSVGGAFSVDENARLLLHYRYAELACMTAAAAWTSTMPPIKVKFALGEHCYHDSVHAFWLGQRLPELRLTEKADLATPPTLRSSFAAAPPSAAFAAFVERLQLQTDPLLRLVGLYRVLKPHLAVYYRYHLAVTDQVCDAPTVRILRHILLEEEEHLRWGQAIYEELADSRAKRRAALAWQSELEELLVESGGLAGRQE